MTRRRASCFGRAFREVLLCCLLVLHLPSCVSGESSLDREHLGEIGVRPVMPADAARLRGSLSIFPGDLCLIQGTVRRRQSDLYVEVPASGIISLSECTHGGGSPARVVLVNADAIDLGVDAIDPWGFSFPREVDIVGWCPFLSPELGEVLDDATYAATLLARYVHGSEPGFDFDAAVIAEVLEVERHGPPNLAEVSAARQCPSAIERSRALAIGAWAEWLSEDLEDIVELLRDEGNKDRRVRGLQNVLFYAIHAGYDWIVVSTIEALEEIGPLGSLAGCLSREGLLFLKGAALRSRGLKDSADHVFKELMVSNPKSAWASLVLYLCAGE
jgi:hypothetical protein